MNKPIPHAKMRCKQRTGNNLSIGRHERLVAQIQNQKAKFLERCSKTRTKWLVFDRDTEYKVIYSRISKKIITVLE